MSLDKAIQSGKERRKPYRKAKAIDYSCRNHGSCPYCRNGRLRHHKLQEVLDQEAEEELKLYLIEE